MWTNFNYRHLFRGMVWQFYAFVEKWLETKIFGAFQIFFSQHDLRLEMVCVFI